MKRLILTLSIVLLFVLAFDSVSEARIGGGRSSGSRGFRGFGGSRSSFFNSQNRPQYNVPPSPQQQQPTMSGSSMGGSFGRGLLGGMASGFLGSMLFRNSGYAGMPGQGGGGFGFFEILVFAALGLYLYRRFVSRRSATSSANTYSNIIQGSYERVSPTNSSVNNEQVSFDLDSFKEGRMDDFMRLQSAWNYRDLSSVSSIIAPEILGELNSDIRKLKADGRINRIENIAVRGVKLSAIEN